MDVLIDYDLIDEVSRAFYRVKVSFETSSKPHDEALIIQLKEHISVG